LKLNAETTESEPIADAVNIALAARLTVRLNFDVVTDGFSLKLETIFQLSHPSALF
jgi:hypothetical protein